MAALAKQSLFKWVESELYRYPQLKKEIRMIRDNIMFCKDKVDENVGGGRASLPGKPTERIATTLATDQRLEQLEGIVKSIEDVYNSLPHEYKKLIQLRYWTVRKYGWESKYTWERIANELHVGRRTVFRMREEIIEAIVETLGWR
ncbi:transcriptional regulator [Anoxybacillus rupiensis]|uniref:Transcriptional regulator n=1 Tax=Anoxybacteroides rupiense TaxID=311460 RepID=A0ABD5IRL9_9BACL|nr:transcriptional regulator [Anoxybacillus rupiensis]